MKSALLRIIALCFCLPPVAAQEANLTVRCVEEYDETVDHFPHKVDIQHATKFRVDYHKRYKVIRVSDAYAGAPVYEYVLVQCGTPHPDAEGFAAGAQFIDVPAGDLITLSTTQLPPLAQLGLLHHLVGVDSGAYISTDEARAGIAAGDIAEIGYGAEINIEKTLELAPDLVVSYGLNPDTDAHPILLEAGIFTALDASWQEQSPLGRAEWLKFIALFYNQEAAANALYDDIVADYERLRALAESVPESERPIVLLNTFLETAGAWFVPGEDTYVAALIRDAGGDPLLSETGSSASNGLSFETVYEAGLDADLWLLETFAVYSGADLAALDERFTDFAAYKAGALWNNNRDENPNGGNNYYEWGAMNPQLVLADLVAIFHPHLLPDHEFAFYQRLEA